MDSGIKETNKKDLRAFGLILSAMIALFAGVLIPWIWGFNFPLWPWLVSSVLLFFAIVLPATLRPVYLIWMKAGHVLGWINTRLLLGLVFYLIISPTGILLRLLGKDPLQRHYNLSGMSYRTASEQPKVKNLERPF